MAKKNWIIFFHFTLEVDLVGKLWALELNWRGVMYMYDPG
jgi:hypothetical protein